MCLAILPFASCADLQAVWKKWLSHLKVGMNSNPCMCSFTVDYLVLMSEDDAWIFVQKSTLKSLLANDLHIKKCRFCALQ